MAYIFVDLEVDGPYPPDFSIVNFGAVVFGDKLDKTFYGRMAPISSRWYPEQLSFSGYTRAQHETFPQAHSVMQEFNDWVLHNGGKNPKFFSDNLGGDWAFMNYYFWKYTGGNPFGYAGRRLSDVICGMNMSLRTKWKHLKTDYGNVHDPVVDALENAKIFRQLIKDGLQI